MYSNVSLDDVAVTVPLDKSTASELDAPPSVTVVSASPASELIVMLERSPSVTPSIVKVEDEPLASGEK